MLDLKRSDLKNPALWLVIMGLVSIVVGGMLSAGLAHQPSRFVMWSSAYLVLAAGVAQGVFGYLLYGIFDRAKKRNLWTALLAYNIGGIAVIVGTLLKASILGSTLLAAGETAVLLALVLMVSTVLNAKKSRHLLAFCVLAALIFVSLFAGLMLSITIRLG